MLCFCLHFRSGPIKLGKSRIFWDLDEFGAVAVAGLGGHCPSEPLEELDASRENVRIAAGGKSKYVNVFLILVE